MRCALGHGEFSAPSAGRNRGDEWRYGEKGSFRADELLKALDLALPLPKLKRGLEGILRIFLDILLATLVQLFC